MAVQRVPHCPPSPATRRAKTATRTQWPVMARSTTQKPRADIGPARIPKWIQQERHGRDCERHNQRDIGDDGPSRRQPEPGRQRNGEREDANRRQSQDPDDEPLHRFRDALDDSQHRLALGIVHTRQSQSETSRRKNDGQHRAVRRRLDDILRHEIHKPRRQRWRARWHHGVGDATVVCSRRASAAALIDRNACEYRRGDEQRCRSPPIARSPTETTAARTPVRLSPLDAVIAPTLATSIDTTSGMTVIRIRLTKMVPTGVMIPIVIVAVGDALPVSASPSRNPAKSPIRTRMARVIDQRPCSFSGMTLGISRGGGRCRYRLHVHGARRRLHGRS